MAMENQMTAEPDAMIGRTIGNYIVRHKLGEGGMGAVYLAEHPSIGKRVAIKVLHGEFAAQPEIVGRFFNEAKAVNDIQHPNIVDIIDFGTMPPLRPNEPSFVYFIMELIGGMGLGELVARDAPLPADRALGIAVQIADALAASHRAGIVHRDLKPDNVMLMQRARERDFVKLLDFGIAKLTGNGASSHRTRTGMVIGTPQYMSPEQCEGRGNIDLRTDVYALGVVLYQMLTGRVPFVGEGFGEILVQQMGMPPLAPTALNPKLSAHLELVVLKALEKRPDNRYQRMDDMVAALQDPVAYVEAHGGLSDFLQSPILRDPSQSSAGAAIVMLAPPAVRPGLPTTLGGAAAQLTTTASPMRRTWFAVGLGLLLAGGGATAGLVLRGSNNHPVATSDSIPATQPDPRPIDPRSPPPTHPVVEPRPVVEPKPVVEIRSAVESKTVKVKIDSIPTGAVVSINGVKKGSTPYLDELDRGDTPLEVKVVLAGYRPVTRTIDRKTDITLSLALSLDKPSSRPATGARKTSTRKSREDTDDTDTKDPFKHLKKKEQP
jgi:serine/threonine-protein kinase